MSGPFVDCPLSVPSASSRRGGGLWRLTGKCCRYGLAAFLLVAAVSKLTDLQGFRDFLGVHVGLSPAPALATAAILPWLELTCGLCLLTGRAAREAAALAAILLVLFIGYARTLPPGSDCGCAVWPKRLSLPAGESWTVARNILLLACALRTAIRAD